MDFPSVKFFIVIVPLHSPMHQAAGLFELTQPLKLPMLQMIGENDREVFLEVAPHFRNNFAGASEFVIMDNMFIHYLQPT
ncbi:hypothetical protein KM917_17815 [Virgibacillus pantothenticus]|uniref:Uncharacterized protein n=3 Tax=Virgibacillus pantothenticus TaxID=1473 RepID=A0A0L0QUJ6_VIRPA|nr:hypothetical protein [Virgibacillus pantothenticus]KNE22259.1 hypothetical protein AFK71_01030 [Virgibacillus pantothenticus]MBU8601835.1 hypothetical protein [Virgibacillus pantothenticus]MBU8636072.1 hypothetical protein [Virgibacillus pantothenticus]MBU8644151.1 hypothetical protein [Virgibacillus pantothenticus]MBU8661802.1 hypothetical protein [Virgibacillus pantothenticus]